MTRTVPVVILGWIGKNGGCGIMVVGELAIGGNVLNGALVLGGRVILGRVGGMRSRLGGSV